MDLRIWSNLLLIQIINSSREVNSWPTLLLDMAEEKEVRECQILGVSGMRSEPD
jgi:hypothetical protein